MTNPDIRIEIGNLTDASAVHLVCGLLAVRDQLRGFSVLLDSRFYAPAPDDAALAVRWTEAVIAALSDGHALDDDEDLRDTEAELSERHITLLLDHMTDPALQPLRPRLEALRSMLADIPATFLQ